MGAGSAEEIHRSIAQGALKVPSGATLSRARLRLDVALMLELALPNGRAGGRGLSCALAAAASFHAKTTFTSNFGGPLNFGIGKDLLGFALSVATLCLRPSTLR